MTKKDYRDYIEDIITSIDEIAEFIGTMTFDVFLSLIKTSNAVVRSMEIIGEAAKNVPVILREKYNSVPWKKMVGMRDKLIHEYSGVDLVIVTTTELFGCTVMWQRGEVELLCYCG